MRKSTSMLPSISNNKSKSNAASQYNKVELVCPEKAKDATLIPILKNDKNHDIENGSSLTYATAKNVLEVLDKNLITEYPDDNNLTKKSKISCMLSLKVRT
jgi:hypothetical protein